MGLVCLLQPELSCLMKIPGALIRVNSIILFFTVAEYNVMYMCVAFSLSDIQRKSLNLSSFLGFVTSATVNTNVKW